MTGTAERLWLLQFGAERVGKSLSLRGGDDTIFWAPFVGVLVETSQGLVLYDTGMARATHTSQDVDRVYRGTSDPAADPPWHLYPAPTDSSRCTWIRPGDPLSAALSEVDVSVSDLALAVVSHLHWDHSGGIRTLASAGVPVAIHRDELAYAGEGARFEEGFRVEDWTVPGLRWQEVDGDTDLLPGVSVYSTPGHTPGHLSLRVDLAQSGTWIVAGDAADLGQNFLDRVPCGYAAGGRVEDERRADESLDKLLREAADLDARLIPGHDQLVLNAVRHPPGGHR